MDEQIKSNRTLYESALSPQQKELLKAAEIGSLDEVERLFNGLSILEKQEKWFDYVLVTTAVKQRHKSVIEFLLENHCRVKTDTKTQFLCTPLYYATEQNDARIADDLLEEGASVYDTDVNEKTPLEFAMQNENFELVSTILRKCRPMETFKNWDPNCKNDVAFFHMVCYQYESSSDIESFLKRGFSVHSRSTFDKEEFKGFTPLHFNLACSCAVFNEGSVEVLLKHGADILAQDEKGMTPVHVAFRNEDRESSDNLFFKSFLKKWMSCLVDTKFNNLQDNNGLSFFHIICSGSDNRKEATNYVESVQSFLNNGVNINHPVSLDDPDYPGYTALHFAVRNFRFDLTKLLLENGADAKKADGKGLTPLHVACNYLLMSSKTTYTKKPDISSEDRLKIVNLLLDHGADVDARDSEGGTPLHYSFYAREKGKDLAGLLLSKSRLSSDFIDRNGLSYLHIASSLDLSAVDTLIKGGASVHSHVNADVSWETLYESGYCALHFAVFHNKLEIVLYLLKHGVDPNVKVVDRSDSTPLHIVSSCEISQFNDLMLDSDPCVALQSYLSNRSNIIRSLIEHGATVNSETASGNTPLLIACEIPTNFEEEDYDDSPMNSDYEDEDEDEDSDSSYNRHAEKKKKRVKPTKDISERIYDGQKSTVEILLQHGADVHARNNKGTTVLHQITGQGDRHQMKILAEMMLKRGVDPNADCGEGTTPLHYVVFSYWSRPTEDLSLLQLFFEHGANINANCKYFGTPLHIVAEPYDDIEIDYDPERRMIIESIANHPKIDFNVRNESGDTPLHVAMKEREEDPWAARRSGDFSSPRLSNYLCIEKLLSAGADACIKSSQGVSPFKQLHKWLMDNFTRISNGRGPDRYYSRILITFTAYLKRLMKMNVSNSDEIECMIDALIQLRPEVAEAVDFFIDREVDEMKSTMIDPYTSLFDILFKDPTDMAKHVKNENLTNILESEKFCMKFIIFHGLLIRQFQKGLNQNSVLESAKDALVLNTRINWPSSCSEHILRFLDSESLRNLIDSFSAKKSLKRSADYAPVHDVCQPKICRPEQALHWFNAVEMFIIFKDSIQYGSDSESD